MLSCKQQMKMQPKRRQWRAQFMADRADKFIFQFANFDCTNIFSACNEQLSFQCRFIDKFQIQNASKLDNRKKRKRMRKHNQIKTITIIKHPIQPVKKR